MQRFNWPEHRGWSVLIVGVVMWLLGTAFMTVPALLSLAAFGAVMVTIGTFIFWLGAILLLIEVVFFSR